MSTATVTPIEIKLGDGSVIKGANMEEALQNATKRVEDNVTSYKTEKSAREQAERERDELRRQLQVKETPPLDDSKFNKERYYQMLNEDPIAAQNYMDQHRFGVPDPVGAFNNMRQSVDAITQQSVAASFTAIHAEDFPATPEAAKTLRERTEKLVNNGFPFNVDTLNYAYSEAVKDGSIKPLVKTQDETFTPPPTLTGSTRELSQDEIKKAEQMSDADLEKYLRSKGALR